MKKTVNKEEAPDRKEQFLSGIAGFLSRYRRVITIVLGIVAVVVVALFVTLEIRSARINNSLTQIESLEADYESWRAMSEEDKQASVDTLLEQSDEIASKYERLYAAQRALFLKGQIYTAQNQWGEAGAAFRAVADRFPESYLAPVALMQAAIAFENGEDPDSAKSTLSALIDQFSEKSTDITRAIFSLGRISETEDNIADAAIYYNQLIDDYPASSWTNLARNRIITLTIQGRIGG